MTLTLVVEQKPWSLEVLCAPVIGTCVSAAVNADVSKPIAVKNTVLV